MGPDSGGETQGPKGDRTIPLLRRQDSISSLSCLSINVSLITVIVFNLFNDSLLVLLHVRASRLGWCLVRIESFRTVNAGKPLTHNSILEKCLQLWQPCCCPRCRRCRCLMHIVVIYKSRYECAVRGLVCVFVGSERDDTNMHYFLNTIHTTKYNAIYTMWNIHCY